jgi:hypothetical protein
MWQVVNDAHGRSIAKWSDNECVTAPRPAHLGLDARIASGAIDQPSSRRLAAVSCWTRSRDAVNGDRPPGGRSRRSASRNSLMELAFGSTRGNGGVVVRRVGVSFRCSSLVGPGAAPTI